jgi:hypothetical protein
LTADLLGHLAARNFYSGEEVNSRLLTVRHEQFSCQLYRTATVGMIPYTFMNLQYVGGAILWVLLGISPRVLGQVLASDDPSCRCPHFLYITPTELN